MNYINPFNQLSGIYRLYYEQQLIRELNSQYNVFTNVSDSPLRQFTFTEQSKLKMSIHWQIKVEFFQKNLKTKLEKLNKIQLLVKKPLRK